MQRNGETSMIIPNLNWKRSLTDPWVIAQAEETAVSVMKNESRRTKEQVFEDSLLGYSVEHELFLALTDLGVQSAKAPASDLTYDLLVKGKFKVDTKALRHGEKGKYFEISAWEFENAVADTIYMLFDCSDGDFAIFHGWVYIDEFQQSNYPDHRGRRKGWIRWGSLNPREDLPF